MLSCVPTTGEEEELATTYLIGNVEGGRALENGGGRD